MSIRCSPCPVAKTSTVSPTPSWKTTTAPLKKGQKVRIFGGNMQGIEAYVQRVKGKRAVIGCEIKYIAGATIEIDRELLQIIED